MAEEQPKFVKADEVKQKPMIYWDTGEKSRTITPHLWNDYHTIYWDAKNLVELFDAVPLNPNDPYLLNNPSDPNNPSFLNKGEVLHELTYGRGRPLRIDDRWRLFPHDAPQEAPSELDKAKIEFLDQHSDAIASIQKKLQEKTDGIPLINPEGEKRPWAKARGVEEPYASKTFEFDLSSPVFTERKDEIFSLVRELAENTEEVRGFLANRENG